MMFRPITVRKFLSRNPNITDVVFWSLDRYPDGEVVMDIKFEGGPNQSFSFSVFKDPRKKKDVSAQLAPLNEMIDSLSKAAMAYAKACNIPVVEEKEEKKAAPKKKAKSETTKK